ncbi:hypothetical protein AMS68_005094 [Peltaster fructicola]|uniref:Uncharacterized protein n=1 Tax=Peltaster fructicola TaxID=286661 RepID=A0A6H0XXS5_9PEZI|nr:hypothetical protein AMS68_005094 [Peltaster fructicola]
MANGQRQRGGRRYAKDTSRDTTSTAQSQYEGLGCFEPSHHNERQESLQCTSLPGMCSTSDNDVSDFSPYRHEDPRRRHSNPPLPELDALIDQVESMKEELARLQKQAEHEGTLEKEWQARQQQSRQWSRASGHYTHSYYDNQENFDYRPRAPVLHPPQPRSVRSLSQSGPPNTRRTSYADAFNPSTYSMGRRAAPSTAPGTPRRPAVQTPRFAKPTAATTRRTDETLRRQSVPPMFPILEKPSARSHTSKNKKSISPKMSRLPRRAGLPGTWLSPPSGNVSEVVQETEQQDAKHSSPGSPLKKGNSPPYMSPTKATIRRETATLQGTTKERPVAILKKQVQKPMDATALALAEVNAMSLKLAGYVQPLASSQACPEIENTCTRRRTSHSDILGPIFKKLDQQGLLRQESAIDDTLEVDGTGQKPSVEPNTQEVPRRMSYADVLRPSKTEQLPAHRVPSVELPALRGQTSAAVGRALAQVSEVTPTMDGASSPKFRSDTGQARVIIPSSSSYAPADSFVQEAVAEKDAGELREQAESVSVSGRGNNGAPTAARVAAGAHNNATSHKEHRTLSVDAVQQRNAPDKARSASSRLNAMAAAFVPEPATPVATPATQQVTLPEPVTMAARAQIEDDVFLPDEEWYSLSREEQAYIRKRRRRSTESTTPQSPGERNRS